ncbi:MAG: tyrosine-type recombinase/integrase [Planctomycetes bacterium]|nr:tyrosine-type recombinase/integrase [Planctomycetota bacterium]
MPWSSWSVIYITYRTATDWSPATVKSARPTLMKMARWLIRHDIHRWADVTPADLDAFLLDLIDEGLAYGTRNNYAVMIHIFCDWLVQRGKVLSNPAVDLVVLEGDERPLPPPPLSEEQVRYLFEMLQPGDVIDCRNRLHAELLYGCALRLSESLNLTIDDLDFAQRTVSVRGGKGNKDRMVPMLSGVIAAATDYLAIRRELLCGPDHGLLLLGKNGQRLDYKVIQRLLARLGNFLGARVHPHLLRHSLAVHLLRNKVDVRVIQVILGHAQLDTTKVYLRLVPGHLREDYDKAMPPIAVNAGP